MNKKVIAITSAIGVATIAVVAVAIFKKCGVKEKLDSSLEEIFSDIEKECEEDDDYEW